MAAASLAAAAGLGTLDPSAAGQSWTGLIPAVLPRKLDPAGSAEATSSQLLRQRLQLHPAPVAVLIQGSEGRVGVQQMHLAALISRRLRLSHKLSLSYSSHSDKGDSVVLFDADGVPQQVATLATALFRDAFTAVYDKQVWGTEGGGSGHGEYSASAAGHAANLERWFRFTRGTQTVIAQLNGMAALPSAIQSAAQHHSHGLLSILQCSNMLLTVNSGCSGCTGRSAPPNTACCHWPQRGYCPQ